MLIGGSRLDHLARQLEQQQHQELKKKKRILHKKATITKGEKLLVGLFICATAVCCIVILTNYATLYSVSKEIFGLENSINQQMEVNDGLQLQVIELSAPDRILQIAQEELGMTLDENKVKVIQN